MNQPERAHAYLSKLPPAIGGQRGHDATFLAACLLVEFGLTWEQAFPLLVQWNKTHCEPRWGERELEHKLHDAFKHTKPQSRFLSTIAGNGDTHSQLKTAATDIARKFIPCERPSMRPVSSQTTLSAGNESYHAVLARLRGLSVKAVSIASQRGLLRFGKWRGQQAWFVLDASKKVAQARRMDGCPWFCNAQGKVKALNLPGSKASWPVGIYEAKNFPRLALCEGGPDLLAAFHLVIEHGRLSDCAPVTMLGASLPIHLDALPLFAGKRVRIFAHADNAGNNAAIRWASQLAGVSADVDAFSFHGLTQLDGQPVKDLNNLVNVAGASLPCLTNLFP